MKYLKRILLIGLAIGLVGCGKEPKNDYKSIQEKLMDMESYTTEATVQYISNKGENQYELKQDIRKDGKYIIETTSPENVKGSIILSDGNIIWQYNPKLDTKISVADKEKMERKEISIFSFLENHLKSKKVSVETANTKEGIYTILEAKIPGDNKYFATEKLWLNNETKLPEKLIIYDTDKKERVFVTYKNFVYNPKLEDSKFNIENVAKPEKN